MTKPLLLPLTVLMAAMSAGAEDFRAELIFPPQDKHVHGSSLAEGPNGDLLAAWFHGSGERRADDVLIQGARLRKGAERWSDVFVMADVPEFPDCNPVLYVDANDRLWLFWAMVLANRWENTLLKYRRATEFSEDGPPRWDWQDVITMRPGDDFPDRVEQGLKTLRPEDGMWAEYAPPYTRMIIEASRDKLKRQIGWMPRNHPLTLPSGRMLVPLYSDGFNLCLMAISDDQGETWRPSAPIVGLGPIQPALALRRNGTLVAFFRDSGDPPMRTQRAFSEDNGESWTLTHDTDIPNPGSSMALATLHDGRWIMIFNDTERGRHRLAAALSEDEGESWPHKRFLEQGPEGQESFSYPSVLQAKDGRVHVSYSHRTAEGASIKHAAFSPEWVMQGTP